MIQLYISYGCPFCQKVLKRIIKKFKLKEGIDYEIIEAGRGTPGRETVLKVGGKEMVPFMIDGNTSMYESDEIIKYISRKYS